MKQKPPYARFLGGALVFGILAGSRMCVADRGLKLVISALGFLVLGLLLAASIHASRDSRDNQDN